MEPLQEPLGDALLEEAGGQMLLERGLGALAKGCVVELRSRGPDDPQVGRKQPIGIEPVERRQQHAPGEIAGRSEQQQGGCLLRHARVPRGGQGVRQMGKNSRELQSA